MTTNAPPPTPSRSTKGPGRESVPDHVPSPGALPPVVDRDTLRAELDELRVHEKAATAELDAIVAERHLRSNDPTR